MLIFFNKVMLPSVFQWQMDSMYAAFSILQADSPRNLPRSITNKVEHIYFITHSYVTSQENPRRHVP